MTGSTRAARSSATRRRRPRRLALLGLMAALAIGCRDAADGSGGATLPLDGAIGPAGGDDATAVTVRTGQPPQTLPTSVPRAPIDVAVPAPAPDPISAIQRFAAAEAVRDSAGAWAMLSAEDRLRYPNAEMWRTEHRQIPQLLSVTITAAPVPFDTGTASQAFDVAAEASLVPTLDATKGLVPANATVNWRVVREDGGFRIAFAESRFRPHYPGDEGVLPAATAWAAARQQCRTSDEGGARLEVVGGVVGIAGLADRLCGTTDAIRTGIPQRLAATDASAVIAAFGADATDWARTVYIDGPVPQRLVLGPHGDRWIAVGVLTA